MSEKKRSTSFKPFRTTELILCLCVLLFGSTARAQSGDQIPLVEQAASAGRTQSGNRTPSQEDQASATASDSARWGRWEVQVPEHVRLLQEQQRKKNLKSGGTPGWRVRVFRENSKQARQKSLEYVEFLKTTFPDVPVYWIYESPFFKVSLGNFRTKEEAIRFVQKNKAALPTAFVVSEAIFPAVTPLIPSPTPPSDQVPLNELDPALSVPSY